RIAYLRVAVSLIVGVLAMIPLDGFGFATLRLGAAGLAMGASASAWVEYVLLRRALSEKIGPHGPGLGSMLRLSLAATVAAAVGVSLQVMLPDAPPIVMALETLIPFGVVYLLLAAALGERTSLRRSTGA
ncbi:MAG: hypothetical protein O2992_16055, partial [Gemmatimonadetes bacterium]|nr:hypothetical protein [Gemmatimonadota bacterium]